MSVSTLNVMGRPSRLLPAEHLSDAVAETFAALVASCAPEHFREADRPVIEALASNLVIARSIERELTERGPLDEMGKASPLLRHLRATHALIASLSVRLRMTPSSRMDRKTASKTAYGPETFAEKAARVL